VYPQGYRGFESLPLRHLAKGEMARPRDADGPAQRGESEG
jgi:hypothetical protein